MMPPPLSPELFDLDPELLWVMHCAEGPVPRCSIEAVREVFEIELRPWELDWDRHLEQLPAATRAAGARVLGGVPSDITLSETTSSALQLVARGLDWLEGDEVLLPLGEFPSNIWPWKALERRGVRFQEVPLWDGHRAGSRAWDSRAPSARSDDRPEDRILGAIGPSTRLVAASWVRFQDGLVLDLARLAEGCRERGVRLVVDGIQGAGLLSPALEGVSALATGGHKGLLAPQGQSLLWTSPSFREELLPEGTWLQVDDCSDWSRPSTDHDRNWFADGRRLEAGLPNLMSTAALGASLTLLAEVGPERIAAHVSELRASLLDRLTEASGWREEAARLQALDRTGQIGPIVSLHHGGRGEPFLTRTLREGRRRGILASVREGYLRIALHGWHGLADIDRIAEWLEDSGASASSTKAASNDEQSP